MNREMDRHNSASRKGNQRNEPEMYHERARRREVALPAPEFHQSGGPFVQTFGRPRVAATPEVGPEVTREVNCEARRGKGSPTAQTARTGPGWSAGKGAKKGTKGT